VPLEKIKAERKLAGLALVRSPRLSVMPVLEDQYRTIFALARG
jgi:predicted RNA-binding protein with PUA-like domain